MSTTKKSDSFRRSRLYRQLGRKQLQIAEEEFSTTQSGRAVLRALYVCAMHDLVMPEWLAMEFLKRYREVTHYRTSSWSDEKAFGKPHPKNTNVAARRKAREKGMRVYNEIKAMRAKGESINKGLFAKVGSKHGLGTTLMEKLYYETKWRLALPSERLAKRLKKGAPAKS